MPSAEPEFLDDSVDVAMELLDPAAGLQE